MIGIGVQQGDVEYTMRVITGTLVSISKEEHVHTCVSLYTLLLYVLQMVYFLTQLYIAHLKKSYDQDA